MNVRRSIIRLMPNDQGDRRRRIVRLKLQCRPASG
jgi:hypothetical protein